MRGLEQPVPAAENPGESPKISPYKQKPGSALKMGAARFCSGVARGYFSS